MGRWVGIESKAQVAFDDERIALRTASAVAGAKKVREGGANGGGECGELAVLLSVMKD